MQIPAFLPHKCPAKKVITKKTFLVRGCGNGELPGIAISRISALPHVHLRSQGSRPSLFRVLNEDFVVNKFKMKVMGPGRPN